ncbi:MAG TPA: CDGSH iron-sulfur domain-containing protein [Pseudonocardia sp.]|jgi:CDGSH-type Zn-finger protein|uniref:CDGSH iron-sulfur domain-containing protein n=1 Tax=Pseudonocardia sp. TaxID=60912 RepID=UPI002B4ADEFD|nr:CDGSH iron-sulfur domain-containing protein [Pseudonocardia sp.]HLU60471.1 CDGSH iron-sulfur domain-containing protein [Pseudonocardia sp.]
MPDRAPDPARQVLVTDEGPVLVSGPVDIVLPDGSHVRSDRPVTALCTCKRSRRKPFCDTSHRRKVRSSNEEKNNGARH